MNSDPLISIIVPIYNVQEYLPKCIQSLISQTYLNLEIILVDDGCTDNCPAICDTFSDQDPRIIVIHQKNLGLSCARNAGVQNSSGDYIGFVDGDDWIDPDMYELLIHLLLLYDAQISAVNMRHIYADWTEESCTGQFFLLDRKKASEYFLDRRLDIKGNVCNKLYARDIVTAVSFEPNRLHEDAFFTYQALYQCSYYVHYDICKYNYVKTRPDSIMNTRLKPQNVLDSLTAFRERNEFYDRKHETLLYEKSKAFYVRAIFSYYRECKRNLSDDKELISYLQNLLHVHRTEIIQNKYLGIWKVKYFLYRLLNHEK